MEIELKYGIPTSEIADEIWKNRMFFHLEEEESREELCFDAKYFDTADNDLAKNEIAYRIRKEGEKWIAALKWKGHSEGALHVREEINVPVVSEIPDISVFSESKIGGEVIKAIGDKPLYCLVETKFHRRRLRLDTGSSIFEMSIDNGWIITPYGEEIISEAELELFSGEQTELQELGEKLCREYGLTREERSKYARGIALIKNRK